MRQNLYFVRHAQSFPKASIDFPDWPLSETGRKQAEWLAEPLLTLGIEAIYCSPFLRCRDTMAPFLARTGLDVTIEPALRERLVAPTVRADFGIIWARSWQDFDYALPGCESSTACQHRICAAIDDIVASSSAGTVALGCHGNALALFLHRLDPAIGQREAEAIRNPDVIHVSHENGRYTWHRNFELPGLGDWATGHYDTPVSFDR